MENTDNKLTINELLAKRKYNPDYIPNKEDIVFTIGTNPSRHTGSLSNFITLSGLPKAGKSTFVAAIVASAFVPYDVFSMKIHLPKDRKKLCYFDTESSDYDFYRQINKIKGFSELTNLPDYFNAYQVREDGSGLIRKMIEAYLQDNPECSVIIIDGLLDLIVNMNDEREASLVTKWLKKITKVYNVLLITVLHQSKSNLSTTGHIGSASDRFAQSTLDIVKEKDKNCYVLASRFMRSDADFDPVTLMNFNGVFQQVESETKKTLGKKASDLDEIESKRLCNLIITVPTGYNDISDEVIERTATSKSYAKNLIKIWINKGWILKGSDNKYFTR
jgi:hypothetical protein